jgi:hypothetical protein
MSPRFLLFRPRPVDRRWAYALMVIGLAVAAIAGSVKYVRQSPDV